MLLTSASQAAFDTSLESTLMTAASSAANYPSPVRIVDSRLLLAGERELVIAHQGQAYHLRLTRNDKLILTK